MGIVSKFFQSSRSNWKIAFISFSALALELALIRQIPAEIKAISYFTNLILFASFFGLGIGCITSNKRPLSWLLPLGFFLIFCFIYATRGIIIYENSSSVHYWLEQATTPAGPLLEVPLYMAALMAFLFSALPFIAIGQALAQAMDSQPRLQAYSWDIGGSLCGIVAFSVASRYGAPPWIWVAVCVPIWSFIFVAVWKNRIPYFVAGLSFLFFSSSPHPSIWSPYYYIQHESTTNYLSVWVNSSFHQQAIRFQGNDPTFEKDIRNLETKFSRPYLEYRSYHNNQTPESVLILGSGTGNDINIALLNGVKKIVAVEIDPSLIELGRQYNALSPYPKDQVQIINNDARNFLKNTDLRFDMILYGTLDSQTLLSGHTNLRLDNYVYTQESFADAKHLLKSTGMLGAYYSVFKPWFVGRIYSTLSRAFPKNLKLITFESHQLFNTLFIAGNDTLGLKSDPRLDEEYSQVIPSTDDWPYIYIEEPTLAPIYIEVLLSLAALILGVLFWFRRTHSTEPGGLHWTFFFLGLGFTLLESTAIVKLSLIFGSTWIVNATVFTAALAMIFSANLLVIRNLTPSLNWTFCGLLGFILANYLIPAQVLLGSSVVLQFCGAVLLIGGPIFCAGICFSTLFSQQPRTGYALGINLIGAMGGGLLEYFSMLTGMRAIWLIIFMIYLLAAISSISLQGLYSRDTKRAFMA